MHVRVYVLLPGIGTVAVLDNHIGPGQPADLSSVLPAHVPNPAKSTRAARGRHAGSHLL